MKNKPFLSLLLFLVVLGSACTKKNSTPKDDVLGVLDKVIDETSKLGEKEANQLDSLIARFQSEEDEFKKFKLCINISLGNMSQSIKALKPDTQKDPEASKYSDEIEQASEYCKQSMAKVTRFERSLTNDEWAKVTEGVKESNLAKTRKLVAKAQTCTKTDIQKVIDTGEKAFQEVGTLGALMIVIDMKEQQNFEQYFPRYKALAESKPGPDQKFILNYLNYFKDMYDKNKNPARDRQMIGSKSQILLKKGISDVKGVTQKALNLAPHCFAGVSMSAIYNAKLIFNEKRMTKWQDFFSRKEIVVDAYLEPSSEMNGWFEIKYDKGDEVENAGLESRDIYGRRFYFRPKGDDVQVFSRGRDKRINTEDDAIL